MTNENGPKNPSDTEKIDVQHEVAQESTGDIEETFKDVDAMTLAEMQKELRGLRAEMQMLGTAQIGNRPGFGIATVLQRASHEARCEKLETAIDAIQKKQN